LEKIIINKNPWQTRVAILHGNRLQDIFFDTASEVDLERCFFKGKISKILPGIQTAFVDIGQERAGFLHITEIDRAMAAERIAKKTGEPYDSQRVKSIMDIGKLFKEGESVLVQVLKEPVHEKGAKLTTCFTIPGRFIVLMPNIPAIGQKGFKGHLICFWIPPRSITDRVFKSILDKSKIPDKNKKE